MFSLSQFVVILLLTLSTLQSNQCETLVKTWISDPSTLPPDVYANSGKFLNDLGDYNNCLVHSDTLKYFTMTVLNKIARGWQNIGLCAPLECQQALQTNQYAPMVQDYLNGAIKNATNSTFEPFVNLRFYSPQDTKPEMDWGSYVVIALIGFLVLLGVIGSVFSLGSTKQTKIVKVVKCFSLYDNLKKIVTIPKTHQNENLLFFNGIKVLSICWVIYGHDMWFRLGNIRNWTESLDIFTMVGVPTLAPAAYFAVDSFFWVGGFLVTIGMLGQVKKINKLSKLVFGSILHRFVRIWPTYMMAVLVYWKVAPYFGNGPIWNTFYTFTTSCNNGGVVWNMFFLDNFEDHGANGMDYCFGWGWYLAVDFQLFFVSPFIMYAYHKNKKAGWLITFGLFLGSVITAFVLIMVNDWRYPIPNPKFPPQLDFMDNFYYKPYVRASAYLMGIFTGFIYVEWKANNPAFVDPINKIKNSIVARVLLYVIGIALVEGTIWIIVPYQQGSEWSTVAQAFYNSLNRVVFLTGVFMCCFASIFGCKYDPTKYIIGHWIFSPIAKVSFCMYLIHFIIIIHGTYTARVNLFWQVESSLYTVMADIVLTIIAATCLSLLVEAPVMGLEKILLRGGGKGKSKGKKTSESEEREDQPLKEGLRESLITEVSESRQAEIEPVQRSKPGPKEDVMLL